MRETAKMTTAKRRSIILRKLEENFEVNINDLSKLFRVSEVTIRHDLASLEDRNLLIRARGGAIKLNTINHDQKLSDKTGKNIKEKKSIARLATTLINEGDTVLIDSGSTTEETARLLSGYKSLTIVTNALNVIPHFAGNSNIKVIVPGGILRHNSFSLVGMTLEQNLGGFYCDKLLLGADAIDVDGIYTPDIEEAALNKAMIKIAKEVIVIADSSKFGKRSLSKIGDIRLISTIVTDKDIPNDLKEAFTEQGIKILIAK